MRDLENVKNLEKSIMDDLKVHREALAEKEKNYQKFRVEYKPELDKICEIRFHEENRKRIEEKNKKANRNKRMREELKIGDWVIVKTRNGNTPKQIIRFDGDEKWGYGAYCEMPENLFYVNGYNKGKYKKPTWYYAEHHSRLSDRRIDLYAFNSIVARITHDENKNVTIERFNE